MNVKKLKSAMAIFLALANICFVVLIALNVGSSVGYAVAGDWRLAIYWFNVAVICLLFFTKRK
jgi:uncharacterized membrane protein